MREETARLRHVKGANFQNPRFPSISESAGSRADPQRAQGVELISSTRCAELNDRFGPMIQAIVEAHVRQREPKDPVARRIDIPLSRHQRLSDAFGEINDLRRGIGAFHCGQP